MAAEGGSTVGTAAECVGLQLVGQIRSWRGAWGFIVAPGTFEGDLFCHVDAFPQGSVDKDSGMLNGAEVQFSVGIDKTGRVAARAVTVLAPGPGVQVISGGSLGSSAIVGMSPAAAAAAACQRLVGTVRSWKSDWGFLICPEAFQGDVFCHKDNLDKSIRGQICEGMEVEFDRGPDEKGRMTAFNVTATGSMGIHQFYGSFPQVANQAAAAGSSVSNGAAGPGGMERFVGCMGFRLYGTVRSWKEAWGFIVSDSFEGDLFAHNEQLDGNSCPMFEGAQVSFEVGVGTKNRPSAMAIMVEGGVPPWSDEWGNAQADGFTWGPPQPSGSGNMGGFGASDVQRASPEDLNAVVGIRLEGTIRKWKREWGFVQCDNFQGDLFAHIDNTGGAVFEAGDPVWFEVGLDSKGRHAAINIESAGGGDGPPFRAPRQQTQATEIAIPGRAKEEDLQAFIGQVLRGVVRSWKGEWGFIQCDMFEGDIFAHIGNTALQQPLGVGEAVNFEVRMDKKGRHGAFEIVHVPLPLAEWVGRGECRGSLRSWRDNWGFLVSPSFEGDLFCHETNLKKGYTPANLGLGTPLVFTVERDEQGRFTAKGIMPSPYPQYPEARGQMAAGMATPTPQPTQTPQVVSPAMIAAKRQAAALAASQAAQAAAVAAAQAAQGIMPAKRPRMM